MKKIILTMAVVLTATFASAQKDMKFGVKGGFNSASSNGGGGSISGFFLGGLAEFSLADKLVLQPGLNYHTFSANGASTSSLSIPVLFKYNVAEKINLLAGPSLYYSLESGVDEKTVFGLDLGGSYDITEDIFVEPRYSLGLTGEVKVNILLIGLGYKF
jgi:hypothetical protein